MISTKWQRRAPKLADENASPGIYSRLKGRIKTVGSAILYQPVDSASGSLPEDKPDNGPFGRLGPNSTQALKRGAGAVGRTLSAPFGALVTVTVADGFVRVLTARGNRVRAWAEAELPLGVVQHGLIVDEQTFIDVLSELLNEVTRNGKLNGQKVAIAITGRNMVQRRLTVYVDDGRDLAETIISVSTDSMSIRTEEMHVEWDAEELDLIEEDELEEDDVDEDALEDGTSSEKETADSKAQANAEIGLEDLSAAMEEEPDGDPYDVYALALHKHVIRRNLRTVSEFSNRFAGVQPKILALAAAVNSRAGVVLDVEENTLITAVVSNGLPEVIREVGVDQRMSDAEWQNLVVTQVSRAVAFYDSIFPEEPLGSDVEVFVTGESGRIIDVVDAALEGTPYERAEMPQTLRAPDEFPFAKYAANVGLVIVSGKRFWQRAPVSLLPTPKFDYRPTQYRPRPLPVAATLKIAAALILGFGVFTSYQLYSDQTASEQTATRNLEILQLRSDLRSQSLAETREARLLLEENRARTERLIAANDALDDRDGGFGDTVSTISALAPSDVHLTVIDDDGRVVAVGVESDDYPGMLAYIRLLEDVPSFEHVQVLKLGRKTDDDESGQEPAQQSGEPAVVETKIEAALVITRIHIDDSELPLIGELAAVNE